MHHAGSLHRPPTPEVQPRSAEDELSIAPAQKNEAVKSLKKAYEDVFQTLVTIKLSDSKAASQEVIRYATQYTSELDELLRADPRHLTLSGHHNPKLIQKLGKEKAEGIWPVLQAYAKALQRQCGDSPCGIQAVTLTNQIPGQYLPALLRGIGTLDTLEYLEVDAPTGRKPLDLRPLAPKESRDLTVKVRLPESDLQGLADARDERRDERAIWVSKGTRVMAQEPTVQVEKYVVYIAESPDSQPTHKVRLGGVMHHPHPATGMHPSTNLNNEGTLAPDASGRRFSAVCRHLATAFLLERQEYLQHKRESKLDSGAQRMHFSFKSFASAEAISENLPPDIEAIFEKTKDPKNLAAITTCESFSSALTRQFESMSPGSARHILLLSCNHAMALELQAKKGPTGSTRAYTARFYDPNATITAPRLDFQALKDVNAQGVKPLTEKIWDRSYHLSSHAGDVDESDPKNSLSLYIMGAPAGAPPELYGIADTPKSLLAIPNLWDLLKRREPELMLKLCRYAVEDAINLRSASDKLGSLARYFVIEPAAAAPFLRFTFAELTKFKASDRADFLFHLHLRQGVRSAATDPTQIAPVTRLIAGVTSDRLPKDDQWKLLSDPDYGPLQKAARFAEGRYQAQPARLESTYAAVHEIVLSKGLTGAEKAALVAGFEKHPNDTSFWERQRHTPLAEQAYEAGDTDMALAMATAILDARLERSETGEVLKGLGINLKALLKSKLEGESPIGRWLGRALHAATTSNWAEKDSIQDALAKKIGGAKGAFLSLPSFTRGQPARSSSKWDGVHLNPLARDTNPGFMVCSSPHVPEHLRANLVNRDSRPSTTGLTITTGHQLLLVPVDEYVTRTAPGRAPLAPARTQDSGAPAPVISSASSIGPLQQAPWLQVTGPDMPTSQACREAKLQFIRSVMDPDGTVTHIVCRADRNLPGLESWQTSLLTSEGAAVDYNIPIGRLTPGQ